MREETLAHDLPHIIVIGNPVEGFKFIGPFVTAAEAVDYADTNQRIEADWWIAPLQTQG